MRHIISICLFLHVGLLGAETTGPDLGLSDAQIHELVRMRSPAESLETIRVQDGYELQLVASEPMVIHPVLCVWDANGVMYVAQMDTYMRDIDSTGENDPKSRVMRLEDTDGDGVMDASSVFIDELILPRMLLPLGNKLLVGTTHTHDLYTYQDTDGDGRADVKELFHQGGQASGNMEHQPSGLVWGADNWIYRTRHTTRLRFTRGKVETSEFPAQSASWGMAIDDLGRIYSSRAGAGQSFIGFQYPWRYGYISFKDELEDDFRTTWPIHEIPDANSKSGRARAFTSGCGHSIYRDAIFPDLNDNLFVCEPVSRIVRRATVEVRDGMRHLKNTHRPGEFIASTDANFRPVNTVLGPDGSLYIVDMHHGIIQQSAFIDEPLRARILRLGLEKNLDGGRIYRLIKKDRPLDRERPRMLEQSVAELVPHLKSDSGWWRDTARREIILRSDQSVVPALIEISQDSTLPYTKRAAALWTLEGLDALSVELLTSLLRDSDLTFVRACLQAGEGQLTQQPELEQVYYDMAQSMKDEAVVTQVYLSLRTFGTPVMQEKIAALLEATTGNRTLSRVVATFKRQAAEKALQERNLALFTGERKGDLFKRSFTSGGLIYESLCATCHGRDGRGTAIPGQELTLAPPLAGSDRVKGDPDVLINLALHGLTGPVDGQAYPGAMMPLKDNDDRYIADVLTYIRNSWGHRCDAVRPNDVGSMRRRSKDRTGPWTIEELEAWQQSHRQGDRAK